jgi:hypothetical protein
MTQNKIVNTVINKPARFVVVLLVAFISVWGLSPLSFPLGLGALAQASNVSSFSDTLSTSAPNTAANHTIKFTTPTGIAAGQTIKLTFPAGFTLTGVVFGDMDLSVAGVEQTLAATASGRRIIPVRR